MGFFSRFGLAFVCFFRILFGASLPASVKLLGFTGEAPALAPEPAPAPAPAPAPEPVPEPVKVEPPPPPPAPEVDEESLIERGGLLFLGLLQREGRFVDFIQEDLDGFDDGQIGAAARDVWRGCRKAVQEHMSLEPVIAAAEESPQTVKSGYDPHAIKLTGRVGQEPPFHGTLRHHGWRADKVKLPQWSKSLDASVVASAEVEVG